jgi:histidine ammonia-lyase
MFRGHALWPARAHPMMELSGRSLTLEEFASFARGGAELRLSRDAASRMQTTRAIVEKLLI